jgi:hypothetical protein
MTVVIFECFTDMDQTVVEMLYQLRNNGYYLYVLSRVAQDVLNTMNILWLFDGVLYAAPDDSWETMKKGMLMGLQAAHVGTNIHFFGDVDSIDSINVHPVHGSLIEAVQNIFIL